MQDVRRRATALIACVMGMCVAACGPAPGRPDLDAVASRYLELTEGLAKHEPSLIDHWLIEREPVSRGGRQPVAMLRGAVDALAADADAAALEAAGIDRARAEWLAGQAGALQLATRRLLGESVPFDAEARLAFAITPRRADLFLADRARETLARELPGAGSLASRLAAFRARFEAQPDTREALMRAAVAACREVAGAALPLPPDDAIELAFVDGLPWDAHARYLGGHRTRIDIQDRQPLDLTRALRLACHEGAPGHHAQHIWAADDLVGRLGWKERALIAGFGPALLMAEGAAEAGADLAMPAERRLQVYRERLAPAAKLSEVQAADLTRLIRVEEAQAALEPLIGDIARDYLDNRLNATQAAERLDREVLMPGAEAFVFFIERRRTRILAYTEGRRLALERLGGDGLPALKTLFLPPGS
jgi:hypothetical protein